MTLGGYYLRAGEIGFNRSDETLAPAFGHQACRPNRVEIAHAAQSVFTAAVNNSLRLDGLAASESIRFQKNRVVTGSAQTVENGIIVPLTHANPFT